jgi:hypothetical protein
MYIASGNTMNGGLRWRGNQDHEYQAACRRCQTLVLVDTPQKQQRISDRLKYDKRAGGNHGRTLCEDMLDLDLSMHDRLEPSEACPDVGAFGELDLPFTAIFWKCSEEFMTKHKNPIFDDSLGLSPKRCLTIDSLHALYLGVMKIWALLAVWVVLESGIYGNAGAADENLAVSTLAFRSALMSWYKTRHAQNPTENLTRVADFTVKMIGKRSSPKLKTKGAETYGLMKFLLFVFETYGSRLGEQ